MVRNQRKLILALSILLLIVASFIGGLLVDRYMMRSDSDTLGSVMDSSEVAYYFTRAGDRPEQALIQVIDGAQSTLDIAIYSLTHPDIVGAIRDAARRGVTVRLIADKIQDKGKAMSEATKLLGSAGVAMKINKHSGLMHLKMTIADGKVVTGGSFNYSKAASTNNDEVLIVWHSREIASDFAAQFETMWNDEKRFVAVERYIAMEDAGAGDAGAAAGGANAGEVDGISPVADAEPGDPVDTGDLGDPVVAACDNPLIKANRNSGVYHIPGGQSYDQTTANVEFFCTESEAEAAGYRKAKR